MQKDPYALPDIRKFKTIPKLIERRKKVAEMIKQIKPNTPRCKKLKQEYNHLIVKQFLYGANLKTPEYVLLKAELAMCDILPGETMGKTKHLNTNASKILQNVVSDLIKIPEFEKKFYTIL